MAVSCDRVRLPLGRWILVSLSVKTCSTKHGVSRESSVSQMCFRSPPTITPDTAFRIIFGIPVNVIPFLLENSAVRSWEEDV